MASTDPDWNDRNAAWWVKADQAGRHLQVLEGLVEDFRATRPVRVVPEPTDDPNRTAYRLRFHGDVPTVLLATVGDVLHNLRSALDNVAFAMSAASNGGIVPASKEHLPSFPIAKNAAAFADRFTGRFAGLWNDKAQRAFRTVQPFAFGEMAAEAGVTLDRSEDVDLAWSTLHRLDKLWNIDKHRRLTIARWWPGMFWWGTNATESKRTAVLGDRLLADGAILLYIDGRDDDQTSDDIAFEWSLVLTDDPAFVLERGATPDLVEMLMSWHAEITGTMFRQIFTLMSQP
jgi:hypothetical protein